MGQYALKQVGQFGLKRLGQYQLKQVGQFTPKWVGQYGVRLSDYQRAISDISGMDIKVHGNDTRKVFDCIYSWLSETVKISGQKPPLAYSYEFADFNAELFDEILLKYNDESIAKDYIEKISIFEYIDEIRGFITRRAS